MKQSYKIVCIVCLVMFVQYTYMSCLVNFGKTTERSTATYERKSVWFCAIYGKKGKWNGTRIIGSFIMFCLKTTVQYQATLKKIRAS